MESLAYIHISLEYEKVLQAEWNFQELNRQKQAINITAKVYHSENWWEIKFFNRLLKRLNGKVINH
jgi:hypothetical protein